MHVALRVAYDGTLFRGLARQPSGNTVENALLEALAKEGLVPGSLRCGSRTDAGVSALENVLRAELDRPHLKGLVPGVQSRLPDGMWLTGAAEVSPEWNVKHAKSRTYRYLAPCGAENESAMRAACQAFLGEHDFTAFARMEERPARRPVLAMVVARANDFWQFDVTAPGFLWNQVRRMVDACLAVGQGRATLADIEQSLASGKPHNSFQLVPAEGLVLQRVAYEPTLAWSTEAGPLADIKVARAKQAAQVRWQVVASLIESS